MAPGLGGFEYTIWTLETMGFVLVQRAVSAAKSYAEWLWRIFASKLPRSIGPAFARTFQADVQWPWKQQLSRGR